MFLEPIQTGIRSGWIEVICGSMFSGKTEEIIRRLRRAEIARQKIRVFKPEVDVRYHQRDIVSHNTENRMPGIPVRAAKDIPGLVQDAAVVGIDEAQFFDDELGSVAGELARKGIRVIVAGLDMDFTAAPFGPMPALLAEAEYITKLHAICAVCAGPAAYSYRKKDVPGQIVLGERDMYEARCRYCFYKQAQSSAK